MRDNKITVRQWKIKMTWRARLYRTTSPGEHLTWLLNDLRRYQTPLFYHRANFVWIISREPFQQIFNTDKSIFGRKRCVCGCASCFAYSISASPRPPFLRPPVYATINEGLQFDILLKVTVSILLELLPICSYGRMFWPEYFRILVFLCFEWDMKKSQLLSTTNYWHDKEFI